MSRRKRAVSREIIPDPIFKDVIVTKLVNHIMMRGQKATAQRHFYTALEEIKEKVQGEEPINVVKKAIENLKPSIEVRSRRVGGATYQVPVDVRPSRRLSLAMRWLVNYARERGEKTFAKRFAGEVIDAYNNRGSAIKKKEDVHKMAESNKAFAHYNW